MMSKYVITDPCYLLKNPDEWKQVGSLISKESKNVHYTAAEECLSKLLNTEVYSLSRTGYGNWMNFISPVSKDVEIHKTSFTADSGLVCVVKATDSILKQIRTDALGRFALFETDKEIDDVGINISNPEWYVLFVVDKEGVLVKTDDYDLPF